jgi:hypothetical protein
MADALHALEKLADAADALETGAGSVHERLFEAFTYLVLIGPEDVPDGELRLAFAELMGALTSEEAKGTEGRLVATLMIVATSTPRTSPVPSSTCTMRLAGGCTSADPPRLARGDPSCSS